MHDTPEVTKSKVAERELPYHKVLSVDVSLWAERLDAGFLEKQQCVMELTVGEPYLERGEHYEAQKLYVFRVVNKDDDNYQDMVGMAKKAEIEPTDYILIARKYGGTGFAAGAFLPDVKESADKTRMLPSIGREGNIRWVEYGHLEHEEDEKWTPFEQNKSIAGRQVSIAQVGTTGNELSVIGLSPDSKTVVRATFTESYPPDTAEEPEQAAELEETKKSLGRMARIGNRLPRFRKRES